MAPPSALSTMYADEVVDLIHSRDLRGESSTTINIGPGTTEEDVRMMIEEVCGTSKERIGCSLSASRDEGWATGMPAVTFYVERRESRDPGEIYSS